jgi:hypothetical protein
MIRNHLVDSCYCYRANVGAGYTSGKKEIFRPDRPMAVPVKPGDVVLYNARRFDTGLPVGFHDLFGFVPVTITPEMVGQTFARFISWEVKDEKGRMRPGQVEFRNAINGAGGISGVVRSVDDAQALVDKAKAGRTCH